MIIERLLAAVEAVGVVLPNGPRSGAIPPGTPLAVVDGDLPTKVLHGIEEIRSAALELRADDPVAHHVTNIVITSAGDDRVSARSNGIAVTANGRCGSAT
jgi:hypothetical protein